ncbi:MAG: amino acid permease-associated region [Pseudonocardia sp.]|jgi:amino acid transporter|uniref:APC family permease n=1 Tax=Pseudonocardia sp. TaxID=60912 RepID=UPI00262E1383|nr:amino acid permease [Pseudonocardia sp.]MCU1626590.1 amino acid permease-associated region [Pseudonocardia sp.]MDT7703183.1 proline-specific permease ProY [Pseudonocardiales bacterium]HEV7469146.1 amino acid permease [Pseudonocardia sp.]
MSTSDDLSEDDLDDIELVDEKPLSWFDVSAIGTGEMLFTAGWAWIVFIAASYGILWSILGFVGGAIVIHTAWWLYREMITAVPEPGSLQSYAREAGVFPLGTSYLILYAPVYGAFMWLELLIADELLALLFPAVPAAVWPYVVLVPVIALNLLGHQITGKVQSVLVVITLAADIVLAVAVIALIANTEAWDLNWPSPTPVTFMTFFTVTGLWLGIMAGIMEVQQVLVDEWKDFGRSRDVGLMSAAWQLWIRQIPLALGVLGSLPVAALLVMPVPTIGVVEAKFGQNPLFYLALFAMLIATYTTLSVYFMGMGKILALYSQQGALPRAVGRYSRRSVPWVAIVILGLFALIGAYWSDFAFVSHVLSTWSTTLYFVVALLYLLMKRRKDLDRPIVSRFGTPLAVFLLVFTAVIGVAIAMTDWTAALTWVALVVIVVVYDMFVVPRTKRGAFYREQILRRRTSAARL